MDLARRTPEQVRPAQHVRDAHGRIVRDHRQLIPPNPVRATKHERADLPSHILLNGSPHIVCKGHPPRRRAPSQRPRSARPCRAAIARSRIDRLGTVGR